MPSVGVETRNVLIRVTLPKRTGRKRKRGSDEPFTSDQDEAPSSQSIRSPDLLRQLRDNAGGYKVEPLGMIRETHRLRSQPDFQMQTGNIAAMQQIKPLVGQLNYQALKNFKIDVSHGVAGNDDFPLPPNLTVIDQPYQYQYVQAPYVVYTEAADGTLTSINTYGSHRRIMEPQAIDVETVPQAPPPDLRLHGKNDKEVKRAIEALQNMLADRPIATKRVIANHLHEFSDDVWKEATQWVGYMFSAGPWRDCLIRYGVDPRTDPIYRNYQPLMFQLDRKTLGIFDNRPTTYRGLDAREDPHTSHIFDGETMPANVKTFQVCDITDPFLRKILDATELPQRCDIHHNGWFYSGTLAKVRLIMREKARCLLTGQELAHAEYEVVAKAPDNIYSTAGEAFLAGWNAREHGKKAGEMMQDWRNMARQSAKRTRFLVAAGGTGEESEQGTPAVTEEGDGEAEEAMQEDQDIPDASG